jgi:hypothetical protein
MTQAPAQPVLPAFEGRPVVGSRIKITKTGDGLSEALKVAPIALAYDDDVYVVLHGKVSDIANHGDSDGNLIRIHTVPADSMALIDEDTARKAIQAAAEETERLKAEQAGQLALGAEQAAEAREAND